MAGSTDIYRLLENWKRDSSSSSGGSLANWLRIKGNSVEYTYNTFNGVEEVETAVYKTGATTVVTLTYAYSAAQGGGNKVTSITAS